MFQLRHAWSLSQGSGAPAPHIFGTSYTYPTRYDTHQPNFTWWSIIKLDQRKILQGRPRPQPWPKMLTRDLFALAKLLVYIHNKPAEKCAFTRVHKKITMNYKSKTSPWRHCNTERVGAIFFILVRIYSLHSKHFGGIFISDRADVHMLSSNITVYDFCGFRSFRNGQREDSTHYWLSCCEKYEVGYWLKAAHRWHGTQA